MFAFEGPSDHESHRFTHPFQIVSSLVEQDPSTALSEQLAELPTNTLSYIIQNCMSIKFGVVDLVFRSAGLNLLCSAYGGSVPWFIHPSAGPLHHHTVARTLKRKRKAKTNGHLSRWKLFTNTKELLKELIDNHAESLYTARRDDFISSAENGRSYFSTILRLMSMLADLDETFVWYILYSFDGFFWSNCTLLYLIVPQGVSEACDECKACRRRESQNLAQ